METVRNAFSIIRHKCWCANVALVPLPQMSLKVSQIASIRMTYENHKLTGIHTCKQMYVCEQEERQIHIYHIYIHTCIHIQNMHVYSGNMRTDKT